MSHACFIHAVNILQLEEGSCVETSFYIGIYLPDAVSHSTIPAMFTAFQRSSNIFLRKT